MRTNSRQRLFEVMQKVNPDFIVKEAETPQTYSAAELEILARMAYNVQMHGYMVRSPLTYDMIYDYNQKHGNIIKFPLVEKDKSEIINTALESLYGDNATDEQRKKLESLTGDQLIEFLTKQFSEYENMLRKQIQDSLKANAIKQNKPPPDVEDNWYESIIVRGVRDKKYELENLIHQIRKAYKYTNATSSQNLNSNFYEMYPFSQVFWHDKEKYSSDQLIEITKSLVQKGAIIVIPLTEEEKVEMDKVYNGNIDYLTPTWGHGKEGYAHLIFLENLTEIINKENEQQIANFTFTKEYLNDLLSTSMEGGSNYWALFDHRFIAPELANQKIPLSEKIINSVWDYKKSIPVYDVESGEEDDTEQSVYDNPNSEYANPYEGYERLGELSLDSILQAISLVKKDPKYKHIWENIASENYDAGDADVFFQLAIMNEIVFG